GRSISLSQGRFVALAAWADGGARERTREDLRSKGRLGVHSRLRDSPRVYGDAHRTPGEAGRRLERADAAICHSPRICSDTCRLGSASSPNPWPRSRLL